MSSVSVNVEVALVDSKSFVLDWLLFFLSFFFASLVGEDPNNAGIGSEQSNTFNIVLPEYKYLRTETFDEDGIAQSHCIVSGCGQYVAGGVDRGEILACPLILGPHSDLTGAQVNVEDTIEMLPKSRRALTIQEIAALARSSLHGISQVVKDHVTKPTAMAQGRVAHLIEWKGWCKPIDSPATLESTFNSYSDLSEGEQEARFAAGVAEQFAIAEAKLRAWSSVEGDDSNDESYDEDFPTSAETAQAADAVGQLPTSTLLKGFLHSRLCHLSSRQGSCDPESESSQSTISPETLCSSLCSLDESFLLKELGSPSELAAKLLGSVSGGEDMLLSKPTQTPGECAFRSLAQLECQDSMYSMSFTESCLSPTEEEGLPCKDYKVHGDSCQVRRKVSDVASSGVVSLDDNEDDEVDEDPEEDTKEP